MFRLIQLIFFSLLLAALGCALLAGAGLSPGLGVGVEPRRRRGSVGIWNRQGGAAGPGG
jgi:hypothetical protein